MNPETLVIIQHDNNEELIAASAGIPLSASHKSQHDHHTDELRKMIFKLSDSQSKKISAQEILVNLSDWDACHIITEDTVQFTV